MVTIMRTPLPPAGGTSSLRKLRFPLDRRGWAERRTPRPREPVLGEAHKRQRGDGEPSCRAEADGDALDGAAVLPDAPVAGGVFRGGVRIEPAQPRDLQELAHVVDLGEQPRR